MDIDESESKPKILVIGGSEQNLISKIVKVESKRKQLNKMLRVLVGLKGWLCIFGLIDLIEGWKKK